MFTSFALHCRLYFLIRAAVMLQLSLSRHPKAHGLNGKLIEPGQLLQQACFHAGAHAGVLFDMTPLDWVLRGLRDSKFKLCPSWVTGKGVAHDPVRLNRCDRILKHPPSCSERDLICVLHGSCDKTGERRASCVRLGDSACVLDPELLATGHSTPCAVGARPLRTAGPNGTARPPRKKLSPPCHLASRPLGSRR